MTGVRHNEMLSLLALRQVIALNWGTLTRHASSYTTSLSPTTPELTFYHRVRVRVRVSLGLVLGLGLGLVEIFIWFMKNLLGLGLVESFV